MRIAIIGGGAAGVTCAGFLRRPDLWKALQSDKAQVSDIVESSVPEVFLFEKGESLLRKVRATGNGRCNFTNSHVSPAHYTGQSGRQSAHVLEIFPFAAALRLFGLLGMPAVTFESGMTYPATLRAETVVNRLSAWLTDAGVHTVCSCGVQAIHKEGDRFVLRFENRKEQSFDRVVIATGGSYGIGKKEWSNGYSLAKALGHHLTSLHAGMVPLEVEEKARTSALAGIKMTAALSAQGQQVTDDLLFTEYGLSGIGILRLSNRILDAVVTGVLNTSSEQLPTVCVNLLPQHSVKEWISNAWQLHARFPSWRVADVLSGMLPEAVVRQLAKECEVDADEAPDKENLERILTRACAWHFIVRGVHKKDHGHVTCGGVSTDEIDMRSLQSLTCPGLYLIGEVIDIVGECGGYNLHWAWASAYAAAGALLAE